MERYAEEDIHIIKERKTYVIINEGKTYICLKKGRSTWI